MEQKIILTLLVAWFGLSCKPETQSPNSVTKNVAIVRYGGNEQNGGCGYLLKIDDKFYKPDSLSEDLRIEDLQVDVGYVLTDQVQSCYYWGSTGPDPLPNQTPSKINLQVIIIHSIRKK